jgi:hypothetical protein
MQIIFGRFPRYTSSDTGRQAKHENSWPDQPQNLIGKVTRIGPTKGE